MLTPRAEPLSGMGNSSFLGHRLQHAHFDVETTLGIPADVGVSAGLAIFQNEGHNISLGIRRVSTTQAVIFADQVSDMRSGLGEAYSGDLNASVSLRISGDGSSLSLSYSTEPGKWTKLGEDWDARILSTKVAGGFVGTVVGPFARIETQ